MSVSLVKRPKPQGTLWVCVDCLMMAANDEAPTDPQEGQPEPWAIENATDVTMGLIGTEHECTEKGTEWAHGVADDCDCETREFSWSPCDACGSTLGGSRHAFTWWA